MRRRRTIFPSGMGMMTVPLPRNMKRSLEDIADAKNLSTSALVRNVLRAYLDAREKIKKEQRAKDAVRCEQDHGGAFPISQPRAAAGDAR